MRVESAQAAKRIRQSYSFRLYHRIRRFFPSSDSLWADWPRLTGLLLLPTLPKKLGRRSSGRRICSLLVHGGAVSLATGANSIRRRRGENETIAKI